MRYTNILLTVIAVCLVYQCAKYSAEPTSAAVTTPLNAGPVRVEIVGKPTVTIAGLESLTRNPVKVEVTNSDGIPIKGPSYGNPIAVKVTSVDGKVPVDIQDSETMNVRVESMPR